MTYLMEESGIRYYVPNTITTLYFHLGFPCKDEGIRSTVNSACTHCDQQLGQEGDGPLPRSEDAFYEDLGCGAAINVVSSRPGHRLTSGILKDAMNGLWELLVVEGRYMESKFNIYHGRCLTIREAPETGLLLPVRVGK